MNENDINAKARTDIANKARVVREAAEAAAKAKTDTTQKANNPPHDPLADARNRAQDIYLKPKTPNMTPKASNDDAEPLHANENAGAISANTQMIKKLNATLVGFGKPTGPHARQLAGRTAANQNTVHGAQRQMLPNPFTHFNTPGGTPRRGFRPGTLRPNQIPGRSPRSPSKTQTKDEGGILATIGKIVFGGLMAIGIIELLAQTLGVMIGNFFIDKLINPMLKLFHMDPIARLGKNDKLDSGSGPGLQKSVTPGQPGAAQPGGATPGALSPAQQVQSGGTQATSITNSADLSGTTVDRASTLLRSKEGFQETAKWDKNHLRLGYGSDTITDPKTGQHREVRAGDKVDQAGAEADLKRRIGEFADTVIKQLGSGTWNKLPPNAQAALISVGYNYGSLPQSVVTAAKSGDLKTIGDAVEALSTDNGGINASRRKDEAQLVRGAATTNSGSGNNSGAFNPADQVKSGGTAATVNSTKSEQRPGCISTLPPPASSMKPYSTQKF